MVTSAHITEVKYKKYDSATGDYELHHVVHDMPVCTFLLGLDNLSAYADLHWSMDFLNPEHTSATVYLKFF